MARTPYDREHDRELLKHEPRPTDPPHRLIKPIAEALEIAVLVKTVDPITGAGLIAQYAATVAASAKLDLAVEYDRRIGSALESPLVPR